MGVSASTCGCAAVAWVGRDRDGIGNGRKVGDKVSVALYGEGVTGISGDYAAVFCPVGEGVTRGRCSVHGAVLSVGVTTAAAHRATCCRIGRSGDGISIKGKVSHQVTITRHAEGVAGIG